MWRRTHARAQLPTRRPQMVGGVHNGATNGGWCPHRGETRGEWVTGCVTKGEWVNGCVTKGEWVTGCVTKGGLGEVFLVTRSP